MKNRYALRVVICVMALFFIQMVDAQPKITSVTPGSGTPGKLVIINGTGFNATPAQDKVYFGSVAVSVISASTTSLTVSAPPQATYSPISVTTGGLTAYSPLPFVVTFNPFDTLTTGSFGNRQQPLMPSGPQASAIFDVDGDGKPDVVTISFSGNRLSILPNTSSSGSISFGARIDTVTGNNPQEIAIADIDGDGKLDVVYVDFGDGTVSVFRNTSTPGNISFAPRVFFTAGNEPTGVAVGDLDGDGKPDVVVANTGSGNVMIFHNTSTAGTISFAAPITISNLPNPGLPHSVAIGDLDGDGLVDIAVTNVDQREVSILQNVSTPGTIAVTKAAALQLMPDSLHAPEFVTMGDIDGDGKLDLVVSDTASSVFVLRNIGSGAGNFSFAPLVRYFKGQGVGAVTVADLDGDGRPDIAAGNSADNTVSIFKNLSPLGGVSFAPKVDIPMGAYPIRIAAGDIDGDGHPDLVVPDYQGGSIDVYRNQSANGWVNVNFALFLQGCYVTGADTMLLTLRKTAGFISHFASVPVPARAVDSITIELRDK
ncbi:MAG TPA: FG-GAP-like repeat-containing protein, partial [Bacteroidota bacterium]|nr:FG-GAP-like repeat-containing protein [Bacteroidota bacterium]